MKYLKLNIQLFGASASNSTTLTAAVGNKGTLSVSFVENSTNSSTNKSNITVTATFKMTSGGYAQYSTPRVEIYWCDNYGYTTITRMDYTNAAALSRNESVTATATFDVEHKADGTLSGYARANWVWDKGGYCPPSGSVSTSNTSLTTILRGITEITNVTGSTSYVNGTFTVTANPQASGKYYQAEWYLYNQNGNYTWISTDNLGTFGTGSRTIQTKTFTSAQLTTIYTNSINTSKPTIYLRVHTYNDSGYNNLIMSTPAWSFGSNLPESVKPTGTTTIADTVTKPSGLTDYVRSISKPRFTISITNSNGATISNCVIKLNGSQIHSWNTASTSYTYTHTEALPNISNSYEVTATDTRGRSYIASGTITALDYNDPQINFTAERNSSTNTTINLVINGSITALNNKNAKSFIIEKKLSSATTWSTVTTLTDYTYTNYAYNLTGCSADDIFDIRISAIDSFKTVTNSNTVGTSFSLIDFKQGGKGLAFGKAATIDNLFECDLQSKFTKQVDMTGSLNVSGTINQIGSLSSLTTTAKTDTVSAINELKGNIGTLSSLNTESKTNLVSAINSTNNFGRDPQWMGMYFTRKTLNFTSWSRYDLTGMIYGWGNSSDGEYLKATSNGVYIKKNCTVITYVQSTIDATTGEDVTLKLVNSRIGQINEHYQSGYGWTFGNTFAVVRCYAGDTMKMGWTVGNAGNHEILDNTYIWVAVIGRG